VIKRFILFHDKRHPQTMGAAEVQQFLTDLAVTQHVAASTQNQALSALLFLYKEVLRQEIAWLEDVIRAKKPQKLPVVLTRDEVKRVLQHLEAPTWLMASLLYGAGLRLMECLRLRVKDVDFAMHQITVREGKGAHDRVTVLPASVEEPLQHHLHTVKQLPAVDLEEGYGSVYLPYALERKYPDASHDWKWQSVFKVDSRTRQYLCNAYCRISARGTDTSSLEAYSAEERIETPEHREAPIRVHFGAGLHAAAGRPVDAAAYEQYLGQWSRLFVPAVLAAAEVASGDRVLDVATGPGEAALLALSTVTSAGRVIGTDISPAMLTAARARLGAEALQPVAMDGQALAFRDGSFDAVVCQLGLQFFPDPVRGLAEFRRVLRPGRCAAVCVIATPDRAPMWGILADTLSRHLPEQRDVLHLTFALAAPERLAYLLRMAGFHDVRVTRETRQGTIESFNDYWAPIEAGTGQLPQGYLALPAARRRAVREEVEARLAAFETDGRLVMNVEMLIGAGRA
jgi:SAM-dependent methyltransferase